MLYRKGHNAPCSSLERGAECAGIYALSESAESDTLVRETLCDARIVRFTRCHAVGFVRVNACEVARRRTIDDARAPAAPRDHQRDERGKRNDGEHVLAVFGGH